MNRRMFSNDPPQILFTRDFSQLVHGSLAPGQNNVSIIYDAERLPKERSTENGKSAWSMQAFYKFVESNEPILVELRSETGIIQSKLSNEPGEGTMMRCSIDIPEDVDHLSIWFLNTGKSGERYWDSNFGKNYVFRFVAEDLHIKSVAVVPDLSNLVSLFQIEVLAVPEVSDLLVCYQITNDNKNRPEEKQLPLSVSDKQNVDGKRTWSAQMSLPKNAVVRFTLAYIAYGNPHYDNNSGKGYLTWNGAERNLEAGVL